MKKTQFKDALRNIGKQKVSYISIILISFLAVTCFTGVSSASKALADGGSKYYDDRNFRDIEVVSSLLFSESDLEKIRETEGVADVEGQLRTTAKLVTEKSSPEVSVLSLTERVNLPEILEGRLPENDGEIALEADLINNYGVKVGDSVTLSESGSALRILKNDTFTVVGVIRHPDHLVVPNPFTNYVTVKAEAFDQSLLEGRTVYAEIVIDKPEGISRYGDEYFKLTQAVEEKIEELSVVCSEQTLNDLWDKFAEYKTILNSDILRPVIAAAVSLTFDISEEEAEKTLDGIGWLTGEERPDLKSRDVDLGKIKLLDNFTIELPKKDEIAEKVPEIISNLLSALKAKGVDIGELTVTDEMVASVQALVDEMDLSVYDKIESAVTMWNNGQQRYLVSLANKTLKDGEEKGVGVWITMNCKMNAGFMHLSMSSSGISSLAIRFTLLFIVVAAIVIYATVGKIVDEQRKLIGATKALGFYRREIFAKYLIFGCSATLIGRILGTLSGLFLLQYFAIYSYGRYYAFGTPEFAVIVWQILVVIAAGVLLSALSVWFACGNLLRQSATLLMKDAIPPSKKKKAGKSKSKRSLYSRLILRNMRTDLKRVTVTIVSIAGCCALILIGFSIYLSVKNTVSVQFDEIVKYDSTVTLDLNGNKNAVKDVSAALEAEGVPSMPAHTESAALRIKDGTEPADYIVADLDTLNDYLVLRGKDGKVLTESEEPGVMVPSSYANTYNLSVGDRCMIIDATGAGYRTTVSGIFENYLGSTVVISARAYENITCKEPEYNSLLVKHENTDRDALAEKLKDVSGYDAIKRSDNLRQVYNSYSDLLVIMVFILIGAAAAMSAVILTNLVNICLLQKKRELTIMRVNGFTTKEVKNYVSLEAVFTTAAGVVLGTAAGLLQMLHIMPALGKSYTQFIVTPNIIAIVLSAAITALFTVLIYRVTLRKVKDLKLTDIA